MVLLQAPRIEIDRLAEFPGQPCVSIYVPTGAGAADSNIGRIRLKNLVRDAEESLRALGVRDQGLHDSLQRAITSKGDDPFWMQEGRGAAFFFAPGLYERLILPDEVPERLAVSTRFQLAPLLPQLADTEFFLLKVSRERPRLFHLTRQGIDEVRAELPESMDVALNERETGDVSVRSGSPTTGTGGVFHGHAGGAEVDKEKFQRFARMLDKQVCGELNGAGRPLMLVGGDYEQAIYRSVNSYSNLLPEGINGKPEDMSYSVAHRKALEVMAPYFRRDALMAAERFHGLKPALRSNDLIEVVPAAANGRVEFLLMALSGPCWGTFDEETQAVTLHDAPEPGDLDLLDFAALQTHLHGGQVHVIGRDDVPGANAVAPLAAGFRY